MPVANYELQGSIAVVQMDDGKANALSYAMLAELGPALTRAENEASAVVLAGRPERFCAGFDLKVMMSSPQAARELVRTGAEMLMRLYGFPLPVVVACTGHAIAAGALILLAADVRIGASGPFRIGLNEVSIGMPTPVLAMELARDRLLTTELGPATLAARIYRPEEAAHVGYLDEVVASAEVPAVIARAKETATTLGGLSRTAFSGTKKRLRSKTIAHVLSTLDEDMKALTVGP